MAISEFGTEKPIMAVSERNIPKNLIPFRGLRVLAACVVGSARYSVHASLRYDGWINYVFQWLEFLNLMS
jgi:hypothetical protein